jgi:hypothetical protein
MELGSHAINGGYEIICYDLNVLMTATNIRDNRTGLEAEISFDAPDIQFKKENLVLHLQKHDERQRLAKDLTSQMFFPWLELLDALCEETIKLYRQHGVLQDASAEPEMLYFPSIIQGLALPVGLHSTLFSPGGKGKSNVAYFIATLFQYGICHPNLPLVPRQGNTLILDWEGSIDVARIYLRAIRRGLGIETPERINYLECDRPIFDMIDELYEIKDQNQIEFVIIDSQMAATAGGTQYQSDAEKASAYYNVLNQLKCTTLTIDHATKDMMKSQDVSSGAAYGSVVKYNRARSQYELRSQQEADSDHLEFALIHQKYNLGRRMKPLGISIDFKNIQDDHGEDVLDSMTFSICDLNQNPELEKSQPVRQRIINWLKENGTGSTEAIADGIGAPKDQVRVTLNRQEYDFIKTSKGVWGLLQKT